MNLVTACPRCNRVHGSDAATIVGRFSPDGPTGYRAATAPDAPLRETRAEAVADQCAWWAEGSR